MINNVDCYLCETVNNDKTARERPKPPKGAGRRLLAVFQYEDRCATAKCSNDADPPTHACKDEREGEYADHRKHEDKFHVAHSCIFWLLKMCNTTNEK